MRALVRYRDFAPFSGIVHAACGLAAGLTFALATPRAGAEAAFPHDPNTAEELRIRNGLPNAFAKLNRSAEVRVAYLGGSITMADGWRSMTLAHIRSRFPTANVVEINAAISGTGSTYGACRLTDHVLAHSPDLVFVEFRVNGGNLPSMEGIVRQIWATDPRIDICFVYTINRPMIPALTSGRTPAFGAVMETVANRYGIPTVDMGLEVVRRVKDGDLSFTPGGTGSVPVFATDGTHPGAEGHAIYSNVVARALDAMHSAGTPGAHPLPPPIDDHSWSRARQEPISRATASAGWTTVNVSTDEVLLRDRSRTADMIPEAIMTREEGASLTLRFDGTTVGWIDIPAPEPTVLSLVVDNGEPIRITRKETFRSHQSAARFFFIPDLEPGVHTVRLEVETSPGTSAYYLGPILVVGELAPDR